MLLPRSVSFLLAAVTDDRAPIREAHVNLALLMLLALLWSVVLLPSALRSRRRSLHHSMGGFNRAMSVLGGGDARRTDSRVVLVPSNPARIVAPPRGAALARERRRRALVGLLASSGVTVLLGIVVGGVFTVLAIGNLLLLGGFVGAMRNLALQAQRDRALVRLDTRREVDARHADDHRRAVGI